MHITSTERSDCSAEGQILPGNSGGALMPWAIASRKRLSNRGWTYLDIKHHYSQVSVNWSRNTTMTMLDFISWIFECRKESQEGQHEHLAEGAKHMTCGPDMAHRAYLLNYSFPSGPGNLGVGWARGNAYHIMQHYVVPLGTDFGSKRESNVCAVWPTTACAAPLAPLPLALLLLDLNLAHEEPNGQDPAPTTVISMLHINELSPTLLWKHYYSHFMGEEQKSPKRKRSTRCLK